MTGSNAIARITQEIEGEIIEDRAFRTPNDDITIARYAGPEVPDDQHIGERNVYRGPNAPMMMRLAGFPLDEIPL